MGHPRMFLFGKHRIMHLMQKSRPMWLFGGNPYWEGGALGTVTGSSRTFSTAMPARTVDASDDAYAVSDEPMSEFSDVENSGSALNLSAAVKKQSSVKRKPSASKLDSRPVEEIYQKKTQLEHILLRPDTYIGSVERQELSQWLHDKSTGRMIQKNVSFVPGLFKIFDEILVNAADNKIRDASMDTLKVEINSSTGRISVYNNGRGIPVDVHKKEKVHVPELIFGQLLTSSNYDDAQKKVTGGRNGYGAKLCNIFSTEFTVETADSQKKKLYKQTWSKNMSVRGEPKITDWGKEDFTRITFVPDWEKFGMTGLDADIAALLERRVWDMAGVVRNVKVWLNGERINLRSFKDYVELFMPRPEVGAELASPVIVHEKFGDRWEVCVAVSEGSFQQMSFVNSICTYKGGMHVNYITDQIVNSLSESLKKKHKDLNSLKPAQIKNHLSVFVNCQIENPTFDSQTKEYMTLRASAFGSKCQIGEDFMKKVLKCGIVENVMSWARFKQNQQLKKTDGVKRTRLSGISKLDDANNAGTRNASKCTLIITEGDSAKALAVSGLGVVGRDNYGVFPLRGKLLNVREATHKQIMDNQEITQIKQILGLQHGQVYNSVESLRYGSLMIMTDQDHDGSHIKGLVINFLDHFFPSLLKIPGFLVEFITPIVKATKGRDEISFYTIPEYETWKSNNNDGRGWTIKYYKGLGTSTAADARKYFANMTRHRKVFAAVEDADRQLVDMAFSKKRADERKEWLKTCTDETFMDTTGEVIQVRDFINKELILFSMADNIRSIPSVVDGLKPGHRKILFSCFKRKLKGEIKVAQLAGYVSEHSAYHHGEQSLCSTIIGMAQNFVGSNNVNLLEPIGQFGTRLQGGKDAASSRYVFTSLSPFARLLFRPEDDALLKYLSDDGQSIEPNWYMPILPMVLINGGEGIGTGWMTSIPNFNPKDIVENILQLLEGNDLTTMHPWYHGFQGKVEQVSPDRYKISGCYSKVDNNTLEITELPVGTWTQSFKEMLESMLSPEKGEPQIREYKEYHTDTTVRFIIHLSDEQMSAAESEGIEKKFKLTSLVNLNNLVCFDPQGRLRKYANPQAILEEFYHLRLEFYVKRKEFMADQLTQEWTKLDNRLRFVREIVEGKLIIQNKKKNEIINELTRKGYVAFASGKQPNPSDEGEESDEAASDGKNYDYLLSMPIYSLTHEKIVKLLGERDAKETELNQLLSKTPKDLWRNDLTVFLEAWNDYSNKSAAVTNAERVKSKGGVTAAKKPAVVRKPRSASSSLAASEDEEAYVKPVVKRVKKEPAVKLIEKKSFFSTSSTVPVRTVPVVETKPITTLSTDQLNSMSLSERINYMLKQKSRQTTLDTHLNGASSSKPDSVVSRAVVDPVVNTPVSTADLAAQTSATTTGGRGKRSAPVRKIVISSSSEVEDEEVYNGEDGGDYSE